MAKKNIEQEQQQAFAKHMKNTLSSEEYDIFEDLYQIANPELSVDIDKDWRSTKQKVNHILKERVTLNEDGDEE